jgi:hypothetical protein
MALNRYEDFRKYIASNYSITTQEMVDSAILFAQEHMQGATRYDGSPMLHHGIGVARIVAEEIGLGRNSIVGSIIHDIVRVAVQEHPEEMEKIYEDTAELHKGLNDLKIRDWLFIRNHKLPMAILRGLWLLILLPLFILSIIPTGLLFLLPKIFLKAWIKDKMFYSSFYVGVSVFVSVPICMILPFVLLAIFANIWWAVGYLVAFPFMFVLAWNYIRLFTKFKGTCIFIKRSNRDTINKLRELRTSIYERLDNLLK